MLQSIQLVCDEVQAVILGRHYRTRPRVGPVQRKAQQVFCNNILRHIKHPIISLEATEELQTDPLASKGSGRNGSYWRGKGGEGSVCSKWCEHLPLTSSLAHQHHIALKSHHRMAFFFSGCVTNHLIEDIGKLCHSQGKAREIAHWMEAKLTWRFHTHFGRDPYRKPRERASVKFTAKR